MHAPAQPTAQANTDPPVFLPFEAWIWDTDALRRMSPAKRRFDSERAAKLWLTQKISADPTAVEYGLEGPGVSFCSVAQDLADPDYDDPQAALEEAIFGGNEP